MPHSFVFGTHVPPAGQSVAASAAGAGAGLGEGAGAGFGFAAGFLRFGAEVYEGLHNAIAVGATLCSSSLSVLKKKKTPVRRARNGHSERALREWDALSVCPRAPFRALPPLA